jgi:UDP-3-O-[3-hydroxymyristoyl] glucosamine N-acyltransferase
VNIGHDCHIGSFCWINSGVAVAGGCDLGSGSFFGVNASIGHGLNIGKCNFIASNTLINKSTEDEQVYLSEPGQLFRLKSTSFLNFSRVLG